MNRAITIALLFVMLAQALSRFFIVVDFQANRNYIAEFLCVNKDKPQMQCHGRCYLVKKLKLTEQAESQSPSPAPQAQKHRSDPPLFYEPLSSAQAFLPEKVRDFTVPTTAKYPSGAWDTVFRPPQITA